MRVKLKVMLGKTSGKEIVIPVPRFLVGRSDECHLRPKSESVSRNHCAILTQDDGIVIRDLNSRNGTYVNGTRVEGECALNDGDSLQIGKLEFQVVIEPLENAVQVTTPAVESASLPAPETKPISAASAKPVIPADDSSTEFDVSAWLDEADKVEQARRRSDPDTRQFKLDETDRLKLEQADAESAAASGENKEAPRSKVPPNKNQTPGKLPQRQNSATSSREAAADMLKKYLRPR